jgi:hypothetical protein
VFDEEPATEIGRILRHVAGVVEQEGEGNGPIYDLNGNFIGEWQT